MAAETEAAALVVAGVEPGPAAHAGVAAIGAGDPAGAHQAIVGDHALRGDAGNANAPGQADAGIDRLIHHQVMQRGAAHAESVSVGEIGLDSWNRHRRSGCRETGGPGRAQIEAERARGGQAIGHDAFAAGLIDGRHGSNRRG